MRALRVMECRESSVIQTKCIAEKQMFWNSYNTCNYFIIFHFREADQEWEVYPI